MTRKGVAKSGIAKAIHSDERPSIGLEEHYYAKAIQGDD